MANLIFGKPEAYGVELFSESKPAKREVHVTGYITVEVPIDVWLDVDDDQSDEEIKRDAIEDADWERGEVEHISLQVEGEPRKKVLERRQREQEMVLLAAWNAGEPIRAGG